MIRASIHVWRCMSLPQRSGDSFGEGHFASSSQHLSCYPPSEQKASGAVSYFNSCQHGDKSWVKEILAMMQPSVAELTMCSGSSYLIKVLLPCHSCSHRCRWESWRTQWVQSELTVSWCGAQQGRSDIVINDSIQCQRFTHWQPADCKVKHPCTVRNKLKHSVRGSQPS